MTPEAQQSNSPQPVACRCAVCGADVDPDIRWPVTTEPGAVVESGCHDCWAGQSDEQWTDYMLVAGILDRARATEDALEAANAKIAELRRINRELRVVVDRLGKTRDGVPRAPGDTVYHPGDYVEAGFVFIDVDGEWAVSAQHTLNVWSLAGCCSTKEAAQAAFDAKAKEKT